MTIRILKPLGLSGYHPGTVLPAHQLEDYGLDVEKLVATKAIEIVEAVPTAKPTKEKE